MRSNPLDWKGLLGPMGARIPLPDPAEERAPELPADFGPMHGADGHARITGPCGDTMEYWVRVRDGRIVAVTYTTDGCWSSVSAGHAAARLAEGRSVAAAALVQQSDVLAHLGGLPKATEHCALLAANTLKAAVADCRSKARWPAPTDVP